MPHQELAYRRQKACLWPKVGDTKYGQPKIGPVQELDVRWEDKRHQALDPHGNTVQADASVIVDMDVLCGSLMWLGALTDIPGTSIVPPGDVMEVVAFNATPDIKNRVQYRTLSLMRRKEVLT